MGIGVIGTVASGGALPLGASAKVLEVNSKKFKEAGIAISAGTYIVKADCWYSDAPVKIYDNLGNSYVVKGEQKITFPSGATSINIYTGRSKPIRIGSEASIQGQRSIGSPGSQTLHFEVTTVKAIKKHRNRYYGTVSGYLNNTPYAWAAMSEDGNNWVYAKTATNNTTSNEGATVDIDSEGNAVHGYYSSGNPAYWYYYNNTDTTQAGGYAGGTNGVPRFLLSTKDIYGNGAVLVTAFSTSGFGVMDSNGNWSTYLVGTSTIHGVKRNGNRIVYCGTNGYVSHTTTGTNWTSVTVPNAATMRVLDFNGTMWMFADNSSLNYWTTTDLSTFTQRSFPASSKSSSVNLFWSKEENLWYRLGTFEGFTSPDGINWTLMPREEYLTWSRIGTGNPLNVATTMNTYGYQVETSNNIQYSEPFFTGADVDSESTVFKKTPGFTLGLYQLESAVA